MTAILLGILLMLTLIPGVAGAKGNGHGGEYRYSSISGERRGGGADKVRLKAVKQNGSKEQKTLERMVSQANKRIEQLVKKAQKTPYDDVAQMLAEIDGIVAEVFAYAERIGATVVCEYVEYLVDGQYVLIDPIRIIRL